MRRRLAIGVCGVGLWLLCAAGARAAGGPVAPVVGGPGVSAPGSPLSYVAIATGGGTLVERTRLADGKVERSRFLQARLGVPGATLDGGTTGLSADGRTLVLAHAWSRYPPPRRTALTVLDTRGLRVRARLVLAGTYTVDAISPDGRRLYLLHYRSRNNPLNYEVRAYDLPARHMLTKPIVDPREPDEKMLGFPMARTTSADGRWVYTLYQRADDAPFIHALDTVGRTARCIDVDGLGGDLSGVRLHLTGGGLEVTGPSGPQAVVNLRTFAVHAPPAPHRAPAAAPPERGGGLPWGLLGAAAAAVALLAAGLRRAWRAARRDAPEVVRTASPDAPGRAAP
jgi:hypothetical protein